MGFFVFEYGKIFLVKKYTNKKFGFSFEYSEKDWKATKIGGPNPGVDLFCTSGIEGETRIIVRALLPGELVDGDVFMEVGKGMRWLQHPSYGKTLEGFVEGKDFTVDFYLVGVMMSRGLVEEFQAMVKSLKIVDEKK